MKAETQPLRLVKLEIENFKKIVYAEVDVDGVEVEIAGLNGHGKSSVLDAYDVLMEGAGAVPEKAVREGEKKWRITGQFGVGREVEFTCTATGTVDGRPRLEITRTDGQPLGDTDRAFLSALTGGVPFDPQEFASMKPAEQRQKLMRLVGLDFTNLDAEEKKLRAQREALAGTVKNAKGAFEMAKTHGDAPDAEVSVKDLSAELQRAQDAEIEFERKKADFKRAEGRVAEHKATISRLEAQLAEARKSLPVLEAEAANAKEAAESVPEFDVADIRARLGNAEAINAKVRDNRRAEELRDAWRKVQDEYDGYTRRIEQIEAERRAKLEKAQFPYPGLGVSDSGVILDGVPFEQGSDAQKLLAAAAIFLGIAKAEGRRIRNVSIRKGALMDRTSRQKLRELVTAAGGTSLIEVVDETPQTSIVMEAGRSRKPGATAEPAPSEPSTPQPTSRRKQRSLA